MRESEFVHCGIDLLYYYFQRISLNRKGSPYIDSRKWSKNKKPTINPKSNNDNCFQYVLNVALKHKHLKSNIERISTRQLFIDQYSWKGLNFPL